MWVVTTQGFYSVVELREDPSKVLVRARTREDMEALREQIPSLEPVEGAGTDYRWRAVVTREQWKYAVAELAEGIDYPNFKDAVAGRQGRVRAKTYLRVWSALRELQES